MNSVDPSPVNEWNSHHDYLARPLSDYDDPAEDLTNGMTAQPMPPVSNRNGQGQMQDRATRLLKEKLAGSGRKLRE